MSETTFRQVEGCRNIHVAKRNTDGTYVAPVHLRGLAEIKTTDVFMEGVSIGDMRKMISKKKKSGIDIAITANELPGEVEALLMGKSYTNGELVSNVDDDQNEVALLWEEVWSDGSSTYNVIYRTKLSRDSREGKGNSDKLDFQTIALTGSALALSNGDFDMNLDPSATGVDAAKVSNFFTTVQMPGVVVAP